MTVEIRLGLKEVRIGRSKEADLLLPDPSVSRLHARIFRVGDQYFLSDNSKNGTFVEGKRISQVQLEGGISFRIGPFRIHFSRDGKSPSASEPPTVVPGSAVDPLPRIDRKTPPRSSFTTLDMIGNSSVIKEFISNIHRVAGSDFAVLIDGET
ncbi:MAG: FHA domain-containing protein, partial [Candidatus Deferrimicrobiaceae bacterium]